MNLGACKRSITPKLQLTYNFLKGSFPKKSKPSRQ
uniref:Uncharacterized protein n=1 Tax=Rhizophora mucronata TaxID=61149 RepID=A0A2P2PYC3_RHIMU